MNTGSEQIRRRRGSGNEGRKKTDSAESHSLQDFEREVQTHTERRLLFDDTVERPQYFTGTTNDVGNPDNSLINMVGNEDIRITRRLVEEEILSDDDIRPSKLKGRKVAED